MSQAQSGHLRTEKQALPAHRYVVTTRGELTGHVCRRSQVTFAREQALPAHRYVPASRGASLEMAKAQSGSPSHASKHCRRTATWSQPGAHRWAWRRRSHATFAREQTQRSIATWRQAGAHRWHRARPVRSPSHESKHCRRIATWRQAGARRWGISARPVRSPSHESKHCRRIATWRQAGARRLKWRRRSHATLLSATPTGARLHRGNHGRPTGPGPVQAQSQAQS